MHRQRICAAVAAAMSASTAHAAVTLSLVNLGVPDDGLGAAGYGPLVGYTAYRITATAPPGLAMVGVDLSGTGTVVGGDRIETPLHQFWPSSKNFKSGQVAVSPTVFSSGRENHSTDPSYYSAYDSHFVFRGGTGSGYGFYGETNDLASSPLSIYNTNLGTGTANDGWGLGYQLGGIWTIALADRANTVDIAYLVIPDSAWNGSVHRVRGALALSNDTWEFASLMLPDVPEPILCLPALAVILVLRQRCHRPAQRR